MLYLVNYLDSFLNLGMNKANIPNNAYKPHHDWLEVVSPVFGSSFRLTKFVSFDGVPAFSFVFSLFYLQFYEYHSADVQLFFCQ